MGQKNTEENLKALEQISTYSDVYFKFKVSGRTEIEQLPNFISIDKVIGDTVYAYVYKTNYKKLQELNIPFEVVPKTSGTKALTMATTVAEMANWDRYPTYSVYVQMMQNFATNYPSLCKLDTIGFSQNGRLLLVLKITDNPDVDENEPEVFLTSTMHGDEIAGGVLLLRLADYLLFNYSTDNNIKDIVDNEEIWINPFANPDGTYAGGDNTVAYATRELANGVDPNRNFPNPVQGPHPDGQTNYSLETIAMMNFGAAHNFTISMNIHSGAEVFNYPWDSWTSAQNTHADDNWWQYVGHEYADTVFLYAPSNYMKGVSSDGIIEGADWYYAFGSRQDYYTYYLHGREVTLEISNTKLLDANLLPDHWNYNYRSFLNYIRQAKYGIHGIITDSCTGMPIRAKVFINSHDRDSSHVYSSLPVGDYHRPIFSGTYSVTYSAPGYQSQTISISTTNKVTTIQNVALLPNIPVANFSADVTNSCTGTINFFDESITSAGSTYFWDFGDGDTSTLQNPSHTYTTSGTFTVSLTVTNCAGSNTKTLTNYITITLPTPPITTNDSLCGSGIAHLTASGTGTLYWYDAETGGNLLDTGTFYQPYVSTTTTFYVENNVTVMGNSQYVGPVYTGGGGTNTAQSWLIFDSYTHFKLVSVSVYTQTAGNRLIELKDASGVTLQSINAYIPSGVSRVTLNFDVPVGTDYRLVAPANCGLYRLNSGVSYPYTLNGVCSIKNSNAGTSYYYYFFDWEVQTISSCSSIRIPSTATVMDVPTANAGQDVEIASGTSTQLNASATGGSGNYSYHWEPDSLLNNANIANPQTTPLTSTQTFFLTVTDNITGCISTDDVTVTVNSSVLTVNIIPSSTSVCSGQQVQLNTQVSGGTGNYTYNWTSNPAGFTSTDPNPIVYPTVNTTYYLTVTDGALQDTSSVNITILPEPQASFTYTVNSLSVYFTNSSTNASTYYWTFGDGNFSTMSNPSHTYLADGDYLVTLVASNNCGSDTVQQTIHLETTGFEENELAQVRIYPNPTNDVLYIEFTKQVVSDITVFSIEGKEILKKSNNNKVCPLQISSLEKGTYFIKISTNGGSFMKIVIKDN